MTDLSTLVDDALAMLEKTSLAAHGAAGFAAGEAVGRELDESLVMDEPSESPEDTWAEAVTDAAEEHDGDLAAAATEAEPDVSDADQAALKSAAEANEHFRSYQSELNEELQHVVWLGITDAGRKYRKPRGMRRKRG